MRNFVLHIRLVHIQYMSENDSHKSLTMDAVIQKLGVSKSMIRFWEEEFDLPKRENGSMSPLEFAQMRLINTLIKEKGMTLEDAKKEFLTQQKSMIQVHLAIKSLQDIRLKLMALKDKL
jgi:DNA-binding transcriptional MerR regulator